MDNLKNGSSPTQRNMAQYLFNTYGWEDFDPNDPDPNDPIHNRGAWPLELAELLNENITPTKYHRYSDSSASLMIAREAWYIANAHEPSAVVTYGGDHWMLVVGCASDKIPDNSTATIYGLWVNDPSLSYFSNQPAYASSDEWVSNCFSTAPLGPGEHWPYSLRVHVEDPIDDDDRINAVPPAHLEPPAKPHGAPASPNQVISIADEGIRLHTLCFKGPLVSYLLGAQPGTPVLVESLQLNYPDYYMIPYLKDGELSAVVLVNAVNGAFIGVSSCDIGWTGLPHISSESATSLSNSKYEGIAADTRLVWKYCNEAGSPYLPLWQVQYEDGKTVYITQQGKAYNSLTINNAVNRQ